MNKEVEVGHFLPLLLTLYMTRGFSISSSGTDSTERGKGFELSMSEFIVSTSIFYDGDTLSLALAAVLIFSWTRDCWGAGGTYSRNKMGIPPFGQEHSIHVVVATSN